MKIPSGQLLLGAGFLLVISLLVLPVPAPLLDALFSLSMTLSFVVLLLSLFAERPLDFSVFPSLLLMLTLMRLGLNVGSTRLILMHGNEGPEAAGRVVQAFGAFTVGGSYTVGMVIFLIFVVINMMVITKGSGRIAEVAARFTLDAMPGKQMAIDAELNQGMIDDTEARDRRRNVQREADFYGAMDGASKFVKGDAMAGIVIMMVNLVGGLAVGVFQEGMPLVDAAQNYTLLTVGDGLVSQIPALVISTAAGIVVSRAGAGDSLAVELREQVIFQPRAMGMAAGMLGLMALTPGLPFGPFAALSAGAGLLATTLRGGTKAEAVTSAEEIPELSEDERIASALTLDDLELEIGYGLIPLVDPAKNGELLGRIRATRRQLASEMGFVVPLIHIRDNLQLEPGQYGVLVKGDQIASGEIPPGRWLAIEPDEEVEQIPGMRTVDPAFGLPARWIRERDREQASAAGWAVVDGATALATHLAEVIRVHSSELLTRRRVQELLDQYAEESPKLVEEIVPGVVSMSLLHRTMRSLLAERVSIRDLGSILETLAEYAPKVQDPDLLTDLVRERLGRSITRPYLSDDGALNVIALAPDLEEKLRAGVQRTESGSFLAVEPAVLEQLVRGVELAVERSAAPADGRGPVLLANQSIRGPVRHVITRVAPRVSVLSHAEIPPQVKIVVGEVVGEVAAEGMAEVTGGVAGEMNAGVSV